MNKMIKDLEFYNEKKQISKTDSSSAETSKDDKEIELSSKELDVSKYEDSDMKASTISYKVVSD